VNWSGKLSCLPSSFVFYLLDRILAEYPEDFEAWLSEYEEGETAAGHAVPLRWRQVVVEMSSIFAEPAIPSKE